jgi:hypothetical protein
MPVVAAISSGGLARPKLLLGSELRPVDRWVARLNIDELRRVGSRESPGIQAVLVLLGETETLPVEIDHADHRLAVIVMRIYLHLADKPDSAGGATLLLIERVALSNWTGVLKFRRCSDSPKMLTEKA